MSGVMTKSDPALATWRRLVDPKAPLSPRLGTREAYAAGLSIVSLRLMTTLAVLVAIASWALAGTLVSADLDGPGGAAQWLGLGFVACALFVGLRAVPALRRNPTLALTTTFLALFIVLFDSPSSIGFDVGHVAIFATAGLVVSMPRRVAVIVGLAAIWLSLRSVAGHETLAEDAISLALTAGGSLAVGHLLHLVVGVLFAAKDELRKETGALTRRSALTTQRVQWRADRQLNRIEEERTRIARELHDDTAQLIHGMRLELHLLQNATEPEPAAVARIQELVERLLGSTRRIVNGLRPRVLDDVGLAAAIHTLAEDTIASGALEVTRDIDDSVDHVPPAIGTAIYRIAQEAMTNAARHAEATAVEIRLLRVASGAVELSVVDDGRGMPSTSSTAGHGLKGMRERADAIGATLTVGTEPGGGVGVHLRAPLTLRSQR